MNFTIPEPLGLYAYHHSSLCNKTRCSAFTLLVAHIQRTSMTHSAYQPGALLSWKGKPLEIRERVSLLDELRKIKAKNADVHMLKYLSEL
jgi:hypothetical protein